MIVQKFPSPISEISLLSCKNPTDPKTCLPAQLGLPVIWVIIYIKTFSARKRTSYPDHIALSTVKFVELVCPAV